MSLVSIYDVACPLCRARPGARCVIAHIAGGSSVRARPHESRRTAFRIVKASEPVRPVA